MTKRRPGNLLDTDVRFTRKCHRVIPPVLFLATVCKNFPSAHSGGYDLAVKSTMDYQDPTTHWLLCRRRQM